MTINELKSNLCKELHISNEIQLEYIDSNTPVCCPEIKKVKIVKKQNWNDVYQLSHELLHMSFYEHNGNSNHNECIWIEEIVCEAYSIMCLERFSQHERIQWFGYLDNEFYIRNGNVSTVDTVSSIEELNEKVSGYKEFGIRQLIHPVALQIKSVIENDINELIDFLNYQKFVNNSKLVLTNSNMVLQILFDFQESINIEKRI